MTKQRAWRTARLATLVVFSMAASGIALAQVHDPGAVRAKPFELGGYLETRLTHYRLNRGSTFYKTEFAGQPQRATRDARRSTRPAPRSD